MHMYTDTKGSNIAHQDCVISLESNAFYEG